MFAIVQKYQELLVRGARLQPATAHVLVTGDVTCPSPLGQPDADGFDPIPEVSQAQPPLTLNCQV